jgi:hypothetical protein
MRHAALFDAVVDQALRSGHTVRFRAEGISMYPAIRDGEIVDVVRVATDEIVRGDVLLCRYGTRALAHRVVRVTACGSGRRFELRGDAKACSDPPVGADAVLGKVARVHRNGRVVPLCGRAARRRRAVRAAASRAKAALVRTTTILLAVVGGVTARAEFRRR